MMNQHDAKQSVADAGRMLLRERLVARTWGNVSCRTGVQSFVITPSGLAYEGMTAEDVVAYNMADGTWAGTRKPSSEKGVHAAAYTQFPDAGFVIHTHQTYASALGLAGFQALVLTKEQEEALGGITLAKYGLPSTKALKNNVTAALATGAHVVLMAQHGAVIVGRDQTEAFERSKLLEAVCRAACKGLPAEGDANNTSLAALASHAALSFSHTAYTAAPAVRETASTVKFFRAQLDDMAQMIGPKLITVSADGEAVANALKKHDAVLVKGLGAVCRAESEADCDALCLLAEKACVSFLHTNALGVAATLSKLDTLLMRTIYLTKYSKKSGK